MLYASRTKKDIVINQIRIEHKILYQIILSIAMYKKFFVNLDNNLLEIREQGDPTPKCLTRTQSCFVLILFNTL